MKAATEKKVTDIRNRAKSLKASFIENIRALSDPKADAKDKLIPRVSAIVIREGLFLVKIANKFIEKHSLELKKEEQTALDDAMIFFDDLKETHAEELRKNEFIYRLPAEFVIHLQTLSAMVLKFDADVKAQIARIELEDAAEDRELQEEIDAEMIGG